jgi:hypothetical protein
MLVFLPELLQAKKEHEREKACRLLCCWPTVDNDEQYQHNQRRQKNGDLSGFGGRAIRHHPLKGYCIYLKVKIYSSVTYR